MTIRTGRVVPSNKPHYAIGTAARLADFYALRHYGAQDNERLYPPKPSNIRKITRLTQEPDLNLVHQQLKALRAKLAHGEALLESAAARQGNLPTLRALLPK